MAWFGSVAYKKQFVVLRYGFLVFYASTSSRVPAGTIDIGEVLSISNVEDDPLSLELVLAEKSFQLRCTSGTDRCVNSVFVAAILTG